VIAAIRSFNVSSVADRMRRLPLRRIVEVVLILLLLVQTGRLVWLFAGAAAPPRRRRWT